MNPCPHCRANNFEDAKKCHDCGAELAIAKKPESAPAPNQSALKSEREFISRSEKWGYWFAAWGGVILIAFLLNPQYVLAAPFFPTGLFALLPNGEDWAIRAWMSFGFIMGWAFYFLLSLIMFKMKRRTMFFSIYVMFCIFLALNLVGCERVLNTASQIH
jgi:hypothetical protein